MTDQDKRWYRDAAENNWVMPSAAWWKRLPIICAFRGAYYCHKVQSHNAFWLQVGRIPTGYDHWVIYGIYRGRETPT